MKKLLPMLPAALLAAACASSSAPRAAGPADPMLGKDCGHAIVIKARDQKTGTAMEYRWVAEHYPGSTAVQGGYSLCDGIAADQLRVTTKEGHTFILVFDVGAFYGKF